tara:strand:+ start:275 stop:574 length:300 start_codon:yes stop_codon:yes gene_type:complete
MKNEKFSVLLPYDLDSTERVTKKVMKFIHTTAEDLDIQESDVTVASLVTLLLHYLKHRSDDKSEATAHLMSLITSVLLITSSNTTWVDIKDMPSEKDKN